jgi:hypothetical protein
MFEKGSSTMVTVGTGEYVTFAEFARDRGYKYITVLKYAQRHNLPTINIGRYHLIKLSDIETYKPGRNCYKSAQ